MKGTDHFKEVIKNYLDNRAKEDELFRAKYETTTRTIDDVVNYIFHAVQQSGCCGFSDLEVYAMAVHAIDEPNLEIGKPMNCNVVVNHHIELTEEEKAEQRAIALKRYQEEETRQQQRNGKGYAAHYRQEDPTACRKNTGGKTGKEQYRFPQHPAEKYAQRYGRQDADAAEQQPFPAYHGAHLLLCHPHGLHGRKFQFS